MERYIGEEVKISPTWNKSKLIWTTSERIGNTKTSDGRNPSFWIEYDGWIYYAIIEHKMGFLEQLEDWLIEEDHYFNEFYPGEPEFNQLTNFKIPMNYKSDVGKPHKTIYYKLDYEKAMSGDLGNWCQYELDFTKKWNREKKLTEILK